VRKLSDRIDRFCILHPNFGIPRLMMFIVLGNVAVWLFTKMDTTHLLMGNLMFAPDMVFQHGQIWRLVTFVFIPQTSDLWLILWLLLYYNIGSELEAQWGSGKFTIYYLSGMVLNILYSTIVWLVTGISLHISVEYLNLSLFFAYATIFPDTYFVLFFLIPVKVKWLAILDAVLFGLGIIGSPFPVNLLPLVAILNYFVFCGQWLWDLVGAGRYQRQKNVVDFKREAKRINRENREKPYNRKCEVCGRTDVDFPNLEFRYCSRCSGYHCYCLDHINDHVHHTD